MPNTVPVQINSQEMESLQDNHSSFLSTRIPNQIQKHSEEEEVEKSRSHEVTNFYQTDGQPSSISNYPLRTILSCKVVLRINIPRSNP